MVFLAGDEPGRSSDHESSRGIAADESVAWLHGSTGESATRADLQAGAGATMAEAEASAELSLAFAPIHKRAFGVAVGTGIGLFVFGITLFHLLVDPEMPNPRLLAHYFYGYSVSWPGLAVGTGWGFVVGFVMGWFVAFCRNVVIATSVFVTRTRAELAQTREFLDHI
jgi:hypothetical protein